MTAQTPLPPRPLRVSDFALARDGRTLISGLGFAVEPGGVLLVRGPNGIGKSSLLLALAGILRPDTGTIEIAVGDERPGEALHYLGHRNAVKPRLTLAENLRFWMDLYGGPVGSPSHLRGGDPQTAISHALVAVGLGGLDHHDAGHLSQGQTRRLALARLLAVRRPVWLLDEPTAALDAGGETVVASLVRDHRATGGIAVIATHHDLDVGPVETLTLGQG